MFRKRLSYIILPLVFCLAAGCGKDNPEVEPAEAPKIVSFDPENGSTGLEGTSLSVKVTFDQNVKCPTDMRHLAYVEGAVVDKILTPSNYVEFRISGLESGQSYTLVIPEGVISGYRENPVPEIIYNFTMKEQSDQGDEPGPGPGPTPVPDHYELAPVTTLSNPDATPQAQNVYRFLLSQSGEKTLSGVQSEDTANNNGHVDLIASKTGKHPALAGYDFIFLQFSPTPDNWSWVVNYSDMSAPIEHWEANGLVNYMWHWNVPSSREEWEKGKKYPGAGYSFDGYGFYSDKNPFSIKNALTEGTWEHEFIMSDLAKVAGYLKILQDAGVPVIWRPLHEAAGNYNLYGKANNAWFWWGRGGAEPCKQLYRLMRDTFEKEYGLNNLIWVWTLDATKGAEREWADWYPGDDYVDIIGVDIYEDNTDAKIRQYEACVDLAKGNKLVAVSECGNIPDPAKCFKAGNKWSWFMVWASSGFAFNTDLYWKQVMSDERTLTREDMPSLK